MNVEYSRRAVADIRKISAYSRQIFGEAVASALEQRIRSLVQRLAQAPESAPRVEGRPGVRVAQLIRYPYKIFYRVMDDRIRIIHIRHTARKPME